MSGQAALPYYPLGQIGAEYCAFQTLPSYVLLEKPVKILPFLSCVGAILTSMCLIMLTGASSDVN